MNHFSLFTGIGGIDLAAEWAGFTSVGQCEWADYPTKVLEKHWPDVPRWRDVRDVTAESIRERTGIERIHLLSIGDPCQPASLIGKRTGTDDDRWLWPEASRIIRELRPDWVLRENVVGSITAGLDEVLSDLENEAYTTRTFVLPACVFQAPHERCRVFVAGHSGRKPESQTDSPISAIGKKRNSRNHFARINWPQLASPYWQIHQPPIPGVDDGDATGLDRGIALGNSVVPQQVYPILKAIMEVSM